MNKWEYCTVTERDELDMDKLKSCPFCGNYPKLFGKKIREIDGETMKEMPERVEWEVVPFCRITCILGSAFSTAYGIHGASGFLTPEAAIKAWNLREEDCRRNGDDW